MFDPVLIIQWGIGLASMASQKGLPKMSSPRWQSGAVKFGMFQDSPELIGVKKSAMRMAQEWHFFTSYNSDSWGESKSGKMGWTFVWQVKGSFFGCIWRNK